MTASRRQFLAASAVTVAGGALIAADKEVPFIVIVTDPLSKENSCPCVAGYAQRDYAVLGKTLGAAIGKPVEVFFSDSLAGALTKKSGGRADLIIGKDTVVRAHAKDNKIEVTKLAALTGLDGSTTQEGWLVVPGTDSTLSADQLKGYRILFGPVAAEEKNAAAKALLKDLNVTYTDDDKDIAATCSDCATKVLEHSKNGEKVCGLISSYAVPLLEGCGTVKKGELKVVGKTDAVPFIAAFATGSVTADMQKKVKAALLAVAMDEALCKVLETKHGFVDPDAAAAKKK